MIEEIVDFLVIGSGPSGSAATWSLADTGARIMRMERGSGRNKQSIRVIIAIGKFCKVNHTI